MPKGRPLALVTGGSSGIGFELAKLFADDGYDLIVATDALQDESRDAGVTITSLMPGPTDTDFFRRAALTDTWIGRMPKDDPGKVARQGYDALMRGDRKVVASSPLSKVMGVVNSVLPDSVKAMSSRLISK